jgi:hypothetical protein
MSLLSQFTQWLLGDETEVFKDILSDDDSILESGLIRIAWC